MIIEGSFLEDVSCMDIIFPSVPVVLSFNHHFDVAFFTPNFEKEKKNVIDLLNNHPNLKYYESVYE